jgi:hypothetical protein
MLFVTALNKKLHREIAMSFAEELGARAIGPLGSQSDLT